jgi:hypothetical protein
MSIHPGYIEQAANVICVDLMDDYAEIPPHRAKSVAYALADAGLLLTDADRAVLDAAEAWAAGGRAPKVPSFGVGAYPTEMVLARAVRARREATS